MLILERSSFSARMQPSSSLSISEPLVLIVSPKSPVSPDSFPRLTPWPHAG